MGESEIDKLPDPATFRDALFLVRFGRMTPAELDASDALTIALMWRLRRR